MPAQSPESLVNLIAKSKLLAPSDLRTFFSRWRQEAGTKAGDPDAFLLWLVAHNKLTEYQADRLAKGQADRYFLDQYKLVERIGAGRMAGVYKGEHLLGQVVAIKVLPPSKVKDPLSFGRFQREARLALKLKHANVVRTFHTGEDQGLHFLLMEFLEGETLQELLQRSGMLAPEVAVRIVHQALLGLQHLYDVGIIHRDIKPGNLMLCSETRPVDPKLATVKLLDVGLGKAMFDEGTDGDAPIELTMAGDILGSPDYMAPEQAHNPAKADIRADIYSLGCVLYHALAGQPPFPGGNLTRKLIRHATEAPQPVNTFNPQVPDGLQDILDWMLAKDPAQRYPTPERAAQALAVFQLAIQEPAVCPETQQQLQNYEQWLQTQGLIDVELIAAPPAAQVEPPMVAPPPPAPLVMAAASAAPVSAPRVAAPAPVATEPQPAAKKSAPPQAAAAMAPLIAESKTPLKKAPPSAAKEKIDWNELLQPTHRDLLVYLLGVVSTLVVVGLAIWLASGARN